jgi:hypothetical protein
MPKPASYVQPIHFDDFGGIQFERLVFAYHLPRQRVGASGPGGTCPISFGRGAWQTPVGLI